MSTEPSKVDTVLPVTFLIDLYVYFFKIIFVLHIGQFFIVILFPKLYIWYLNNKNDVTK